ncbi:MAG: OmpA family protein [Cytophagaceae bacterium]|nr:OmpA family protein [Cytophagaceae bacterium]
MGRTYKYLRGLQMGSLAAEGSWNNTAVPTTLTYALTRLESTKSDLDFTSNPTPGKFLPGSSPGTGGGFDLGFTYEFRPKADVELNQLADVLGQNPAMRIELRVHTDNAGDFDANVKLSRDRCQSVIDYLIRKSIDASRLLKNGRGPLDPVAPNTSEDNRKKNRRVEFVVL